MIKAVLFDLDGTLLDRDQSIKKFINGQYDRLTPFLGRLPKDIYVRRFIELDNHGYVWKDKVYQQLIKEFSITDLTWEDLLEDYMSEFKRDCVPFPNLFNMLDGLKERQYSLGMITNGRGAFQTDTIKALGIESYFNVILISEREGLKKPDPEIFKRALELLKCLPHECVFIGDHPENDVKAAQKVGMKGIWKKDAAWSHVEADEVIEDLAELPLMIEGLEKKQQNC